jgi:regulator of protease activity HflC (stomatin/prohibitin superfamily)
VDLPKIVPQGDASGWIGPMLCCMTGVGCPYVCCRQFLVSRGEYAVALNNGVPEIYFPGRHVLMSPLSELNGIYNSGSDRIVSGPLSIVRVPIGQCGLAFCDGLVQILLPGVHGYNNAAFRFQGLASLDSDLIAHGPIKIFIVRSGYERVCFDNGKVLIFKEGRYAVNSATFTVDKAIDTQMQLLRFDEHQVLLDGGVSLLVQGLLTYQIFSVQTLVYQLGDKDLRRAIEDVTEAELSKVFAAIHLEQISSPVMTEGEVAMGGHDAGMLGKDLVSNEDTVRSRICRRVENDIRPILRAWGATVISFQLESTKLADKKYAAEYEAASLQVAKAKANLRALDAQNEVLIQTSQAQAAAVQIQAQGQKLKSVLEAQAQAAAVTIEAEARVVAAEAQKKALLIAADAQAQARVIEAKSRNEAAQKMTDPFAQKFALSAQSVEFARSLKANVLTVTPDSLVGRNISNQFLATTVANSISSSSSS